MPQRKRVAVSRVIADGETICPCVIEMEHGKVIDFYRLAHELPSTEWHCGTVVLACSDGEWTIMSSTVEGIFQ